MHHERAIDLIKDRWHEKLYRGKKYRNKIKRGKLPGKEGMADVGSRFI